MEEKKILDFTMEDGSNVSVLMLNPDSDEPRLLFIEKSTPFYITWTTNEAHDILVRLFADNNYVTKFNYISKEASDYLTNEEKIDCLTDVQQVMLLDHIVKYWEKQIEELESGIK